MTGGVSATASWSVLSCGTALLQNGYGISGSMPPSVLAFGGTPLRIKNRERQRKENKSHVQPNVSANAMNRANTYSCKYRASCHFRAPPRPSYKLRL